jgi:hypothetical protein
LQPAVETADAQAAGLALRGSHAVAVPDSTASPSPGKETDG